MQRVLDHGLPEIQHGHHTLRVTRQVIEGYPGPTLVDASLDADLLVAGSRGHREFAAILLGSVGMHCATHAHCPVLVYRSDRDQCRTPHLASDPVNALARVGASWLLLLRRLAGPAVGPGPGSRFHIATHISRLPGASPPKRGRLVSSHKPIDQRTV
jgi:Universal stress protein family